MPRGFRKKQATLCHVPYVRPPHGNTCDAAPSTGNSALRQCGTCPTSCCGLGAPDFVVLSRTLVRPHDRELSDRDSRDSGRRAKRRSCSRACVRRRGYGRRCPVRSRTPPAPRTTQHAPTMLANSHRVVATGLVVASTLFAAGLLAAAGEVFVRHREKTRDTVPGSMPFLYYEHNRYRVALVRDTEYFGWARVNSSGFRGREITERKPDGVFRIMAVGSSTTFDTAIGDDMRTWPALLEAQLDSLGAAGDVEVINAGVAGYRVVDNLIRLQMELHRFQPDMIILYEGHNDLFWTFLQARQQQEATRTPGRVEAKAGWQSWLEQRSLLYSKLAIMMRMRAFHSRAGDRSRNPERPAAEWEAVLREGGEAYGRDLRSFIAIAQTMRIPVVVPQLTHVSGAGALSDESAWHQAMWRQAVGVPAEVVLRGYAIFDSVARDVAAHTGATYLPTAPFAPRGDSLYAPSDPVHFSPRGAELMAAGLGGAIVAGGIGRTWLRDVDEGRLAAADVANAGASSAGRQPSRQPAQGR